VLPAAGDADGVHGAPVASIGCSVVAVPLELEEQVTEVML
jgi:hypothetical protein